ncbi:hypothetical protein BD410DRAFT_824105 [Rickenella mellea]|uniref:Uncharacterized protein n=1 Tax=Rickenella mellea TaxID=50990 RepID=A0A4Y7QKY2_9AGAM|nr:hypothetical protein BD410DRAFT_824105 [Rickenella mellea]
MKPRDYCCCAIPTMNAGIYATLTEQFVLSLLVGILALATPHIVGASVPSIAPWVLAIVCFVGAGVQVFGFLGVLKEKSIMFRRYTTIHVFVTIAAFSVAMVWIIISATKHSSAATKCQTDFFTNTTTDVLGSGNTEASASEATILCNIFTWVTVGVMGALWIVLAIMQFYLYIIVSSYGTGQRKDHEKYDALNNMQAGGGSDIPMTTNRGDPWDARPSLDEDSPRHVRRDSAASVATILGEKQQQPREYLNYSDAPTSSYPPQRQPTYASRRQQSTDDAYLPQPSNVYTQDPASTPQYYSNYNNYYPEASGGVEAPGRAQAHPGQY